MKNQLSYILLSFSFIFSLTVSGCGDDLAAPEAEGELVPITFSTSIRTSVSTEPAREAQTKAEVTPPPFPNSGNVAIVAANGGSETTPTDWTTGNLFLSHAAATASTGTLINGTTTYPINLPATTYWPFNPDKYLGFVAYSPASHTVLTNNGSTELTVTANGSDKIFPDLLYTTPTLGHNKVSGKNGVSLGEFKHAMAKLVIKVTPIDAITGEEVTGDAIKELKIKKLDIQTKVTTGKLDLKTSAWILTAPDDQASAIKMYTLVSADTALPYNSGGRGEYYLFPATNGVNTVELSQIGFTLKDGSITSVDKTYAISEFKNGESESVKLEMGKITTLNIKVKVTSIEAGGDDNTTLEGTLIDWVYKGNSDVTIE